MGSEKWEKFKVKLNNKIDIKPLLTSHFSLPRVLFQSIIVWGIERGADINRDIEMAFPLQIISKVLCKIIYKLDVVWIGLETTICLYCFTMVSLRNFGPKAKFECFLNNCWSVFVHWFPCSSVRMFDK